MSYHLSGRFEYRSPTNKCPSAVNKRNYELVNSRNRRNFFDLALSDEGHAI